MVSRGAPMRTRWCRWQPVRPCDGSLSSAHRGRCGRRGRRHGVGPGSARRHRRARVHELGPEHPVVRRPATSGADAYRIRFDYYENNTLKTSPVVNYANANSGPHWANWSGVANLQHGGQYGVCAQGHYSLPNDSLFFPDGPNSCSMGTMLGRRAHTTIDRSKPTTALRLAADAAFVKDSKVPLRMTSPTTSPGRSRPTSSASRSASGRTTCATKRREDLRLQRALLGPRQRREGDHVQLHRRLRRGPAPEPVGLRVRGRRRDPGQPAVRQPELTADKANLSDAKCDGVVLDRTPPTVAIAGATAVKVGDLVSLQATAADVTSGLAGAGQWTWGDNTGGGNGDAVTHTYTQAGTYEVSVTVTDAAGNAATAKKTITVTAAGGGGGGDNPPGGGGGGDGGGGGQSARRGRREQPARRRRWNHDPARWRWWNHDPARWRRWNHDPARWRWRWRWRPGPARGRRRHERRRRAALARADAPRTARTRAKSIAVELTASGTGRVQLTLAAATASSSARASSSTATAPPTRA